MQEPSKSLPERISAVAALDDPVRRKIYELIAGSSIALGRDAAASALGLPRSTTAFHLDRLADEGLLRVEFRRLSGKTGPGSGRPAKLYSRTTTELQISLPARHYELAGTLMAEAISESSGSGQPILEALSSVAKRCGERLGAQSSSLVSALESNGFEPRADTGTDVVLGTCPFHQLARHNREVVCPLNVALVSGMAIGAGDAEHSVVADPHAGECCVRVTRSHDVQQSSS